MATTPQVHCVLAAVRAALRHACLLFAHHCLGAFHAPLELCSSASPTPHRHPPPPPPPPPLAAGSKDPANAFTPTGALLKAVLLGGAATIVGFEADTGLPVDPPPSFRQGFGRVFLGGWQPMVAGREGCRKTGLQERLVEMGRRKARRRQGGTGAWHALVLDRSPASADSSFPCLVWFLPAGNSVYLADTPSSRPLKVVDAVPITQGGCHGRLGDGGEAWLAYLQMHCCNTLSLNQVA